MTNLNKFQIEGIRQVDEPVISGAPSIPLGDLAESLDKETPIEGQAVTAMIMIMIMIMIGQTITAMGQKWRLDLFNCSNCNQVGGFFAEYD